MTSTSNGGKGKITLTGAQETLFITLLSRANDALSPHSILNDQDAVRVVTLVRENGYDFSRAEHHVFGLSWLSGWSALLISFRARVLDRYTEQFLAQHPTGKGDGVTILHLACGLDARSRRVKWRGDGNLFVDVDKSDVVKLRRQMGLDPEPSSGKHSGKYQLLDPNITEDGWLEKSGIPRNKPVLVIMEGLTMYLTPEENYTLIRGIVKYFQKGGEIRFDVSGSVTKFISNRGGVLKVMGTSLRSALNDPRAWERNVPGLRFKDWMTMVDFLDLGNPPWILRLALRVLFAFIPLSWFGNIYGFTF
ncbi:S-adenosyl-L-methionine-dependent methyltransferase [Pseudomassariella vexata]|uniref:S-adenosyl-L-methionine-dependent methyltransferase n=1 Tax=Pseudomassariella vexata TaxID=1141098 RepID=A0A1Y2EBG4_9PEZI|nr:S-adenosyl-L-methionine-dependent methyltransferase [Pseudomassariella vexata]ORY68910.1 S-adenosyl-L-methionine-dependent methyltransferase [Pseudomassariella vexata]